MRLRGRIAPRDPASHRECSQSAAMQFFIVADGTELISDLPIGRLADRSLADPAMPSCSFSQKVLRVLPISAACRRFSQPRVWFSQKWLRVFVNINSPQRSVSTPVSVSTDPGPWYPGSSTRLIDAATISCSRCIHVYYGPIAILLGVP